jgi:outer membrane lipopolysaccharide assembly protein LptE/RlpB
MHICQQVIAEESEEELIWSDFVRQQGQHLIHKS